MPPKGNAKKEGGRAKKAENEAKKGEVAAVAKEKKVADEWSEGTKGKGAKDDKEAKRQAELAKKQENARLLALEEASAPVKVKVAPKAGTKKKAVESKPAGPGAIAAGGGLSGASADTVERDESGAPKVIESYSATGLENALDMLEIVNAKSDKASVGQQAAGLEKHPERRFKAAYQAYEEREIPKLRADHPGLRLQQMKDQIYKSFQKSPENPFNQTTIAYDATKDEKVDALKAKRSAIEDRLRDKQQ